MTYFNDIILLDGTKHNSISQAVEHLVNKKMQAFESRLSVIEKTLEHTPTPDFSQVPSVAEQNKTNRNLNAIKGGNK